MAIAARKRTSIWLEGNEEVQFDVHQEDGHMLAIEAWGDGEDYNIFIDESLFPKILEVIKYLTEYKNINRDDENY